MPKMGLLFGKLVCGAKNCKDEERNKRHSTVQTTIKDEPKKCETEERKNGHQTVQKTIKDELEISKREVHQQQKEATMFSISSFESCGYFSETTALSRSRVTFDEDVPESEMWQRDKQNISEDNSSSSTFCVQSKNAYEEMEQQILQGNRKTLTRNFSYLKGELDPDDVIDDLISGNILDDRDREDLYATSPRYKRNDLLLRMLVKSNDAEALNELYKSLERRSMNHVLDMMKSSVAETVSNGNLDNVFVIRSLRNLQGNLYTKVSVTYLLDKLVDIECLSIDSYEEILEEKTACRKADRLLVMLEMNLPESFDKFMHSLAVLGYTDFLQQIKTAEGHAGDSPLENTKEEHTEADKVLQSDTNLEELDLNAEINEKNEVVLTIDGKKKGKRFKCKHTVKRLNKGSVTIQINDQLIREAYCMMKKTEEGSLVIRLKPCGYGVLRKLKEICETDIGLLLRPIFSAIDSISCLDQKDLKIEIAPVEPTGERTIKTIIIENRKYLEEEVNTGPISDGLYSRGLLTQNHVKNIMFAEPVSRRNRVQRLLSVILESDIDDATSRCDAFVDLLRVRQPYIAAHILGHSEWKGSYDKVCKTYGQIVENVPIDVLKRAPVFQKVLCPDDGEDKRDPEMRDELTEKKAILQKAIRDGEGACHLLLSFLEDEGYLEKGDDEIEGAVGSDLKLTSRITIYSGSLKVSNTTGKRRKNVVSPEEQDSKLFTRRTDIVKVQDKIVELFVTCISKKVV